MQEKLENKKNTILLFAGLVEPRSNTFWTLESYQHQGTASVNVKDSIVF